MNIIVIVADSLRTDHLGCYGSSVRTPNIDALADDAAVFEQAYSENLTTVPCRAAWWTGKYLFAQRGWQPFEHNDILLAELLSSRGYASALITDNYQLRRPSYNFSRGFDTSAFILGQEYDPWIVDESVDESPGVDITRFHRLRGDDSDAMWKPRFIQYLKNATRFRTEMDHCLVRTINEAERWLEQIIETQKDRLFLWVDSFSPHEPWDPPSPFREMYDPDYTGMALIDPVPGPVKGYMSDSELHHTKCLYAGAVSFMDKWVGVLLDCIRRAGIYDNSLIMLTSDHGAPLGEHGYIRKAGPNCYDELVHIPWIIRHPEGLGKGTRIPAFVQPPDLMPTILDAAGIDAENIGGGWPNFEPRDAKLDLTGKSLGPVLSGISDSHRDFAVSAYHGRQWAIRTEAWTYLWNIEGDRPSELYHRKTDPKEVRNLIDTRSDVADAMQNRLKDFAEQVA